MSYKVAIATSDNITIEKHLARAERFSIYTIRDDFTYEHEEMRSREASGDTGVVTRPDNPEAIGSAETSRGCGCSSATQASTCVPPETGRIAAGNASGNNHRQAGVGFALGGGGCGSGSDCTSGGCGGRVVDNDTQVDPDLERTADALSDVQIVIAGTLGPHAQAVLARRSIRAFAVDGGVTRALDRLLAFEKRQYARFSARGST